MNNCFLDYEYKNEQLQENSPPSCYPLKQNLDSSGQETIMLQIKKAKITVV